MVTLGAILLLVGAAVVSGSILRTYPYPPPVEGYGLPGNKPIISFGVPNFYPIEDKKNCDDTVKYISLEGKKFALPHTPAQFVIEEAKFSEVPESLEPEPEVIPEAPVLPPFTLPELPFRFAVEDLAPEDVADPTLPPVIIEKQPVIPEVSILPPLFSSEVPTLVIEEEPKREPIFIPEAPVLPPVTLPELPVRFNVQAPKIEEITPADIPEGPVLPLLSRPKVLIPIKAEEPASVVIIEEAPQEPKDTEEPVIIPEAPMLPPLSQTQLAVRVAVEESVISAAPELPAPIAITYRPEIPSIAPEVVQDVVPRLPTLHEIEPSINGRSPLIIKAPVQIVIEGGADLARASPDCIAKILRERLIPNLVKENHKVIIPVIIEEAPQEPKDTEEPVIIPEAPMLPPLSPSQLAVRVADEESVISAAPELPAPITNIYRPEIPSIAPEVVQDVVPRLPTLQEIEPFINGHSPLIIKAPVQIVIEGGADLARASPDCIATILRERLIPNLVKENHKVIIPGPTPLLSQFKETEE